LIEYYYLFIWSSRPVSYVRDAWESLRQASADRTVYRISGLDEPGVAVPPARGERSLGLAIPVDLDKMGSMRRASSMSRNVDLWLPCRARHASSEFELCKTFPPTEQEVFEPVTLQELIRWRNGPDVHQLPLPESVTSVSGLKRRPGYLSCATLWRDRSASTMRSLFTIMRQEAVDGIMYCEVGGLVDGRDHANLYAVLKRDIARAVLGGVSVSFHTPEVDTQLEPLRLPDLYRWRSERIDQDALPMPDVQEARPRCGSGAKLHLRWERVTGLSQAYWCAECHRGPYFLYAWDSGEWEVSDHDGRVLAQGPVQGPIIRSVDSTDETAKAEATEWLERHLISKDARISIPLPEAAPAVQWRMDPAYRRERRAIKASVNGARITIQELLSASVGKSAADWRWQVDYKDSWREYHMADHGYADTLEIAKARAVAVAMALRPELPSVQLPLPEALSRLLAG
jgi:hypothetical protein